VREQDRTFAGVLHELEERAKELGCLHRVEEILRRPGLTTAQALQLVVEVLPRGWQFPEVCQATLEVQGTVYRTAAPTPTVACLTSRVFSAEQQVGQLQVCYTQPVPVFDEDLIVLPDGTERGSLQVKRTHGGGGTFHHSTIDI